MAELRGGSTVGGYPIETTKGSQEKINLHASDSKKHVTDAERSAWNAKAGTAVVTTTANGLMTFTDKVKLNGIATGANNYTLPAATESALGGVKTGTNITNSSGVISVANASTSARGVVQLNNSLTSTATDQAATAAQAKVLNDKISTIQAKTITVGRGGNGKRYIKIAEMPTPTVVSTDASNLSILITGVGDFGSNKPGSVIAHLSNRGSVGGQVYVINDNNIKTSPLGYVINTTTNKVDVYYIDVTSYNFTLSIEILSNEGNTVKNFSTVSTAPEGLTLYSTFNHFETTAGAQAKVNTHANDTTSHITAAERTAWNAKASTAVATTSANGLMSSTDKTKLNGIATGANNYSLPTATASVLGGVKTGTNITNSSGTISVADASKTTKGVVMLTDDPNDASSTKAASGVAMAAVLKKVNESIDATFQSVSNGKSKIATAITGKGVTAAGSESFDSLSSKISSISTVKSSRTEIITVKPGSPAISAGDFVQAAPSFINVTRATTPSLGISGSTLIAFDSKRLVLLYRNSSNQFSHITMSRGDNDVINTGIPTIMAYENIAYVKHYKLTDTTALIVYPSYTAGYIRAAVLTLNLNATLTMSSIVNLAQGTSTSITITRLPDGKFIVAHRGSQYNVYINTIITVNGTSITVNASYSDTVSSSFAVVDNKNTYAINDTPNSGLFLRHYTPESNSFGVSIKVSDSPGYGDYRVFTIPYNRIVVFKTNGYKIDITLITSHTGTMIRRETLLGNIASMSPDESQWCIKIDKTKFAVIGDSATRGQNYMATVEFLDDDIIVEGGLSLIPTATNTAGYGSLQLLEGTHKFAAMCTSIANSAAVDVVVLNQSGLEVQKAKSKHSIYGVSKAAYSPGASAHIQTI